MFMILGVLLAVGIGISVQWAEMRRAQMQNLLDGAVLAATDLDQLRDPKIVVEDYFTRADMAEMLKETTVSSGINFRTVGARAESEMQTFFMVTPESWTIAAASEANETVENIEISMVLDISGSMRFDDRITPLREAAKDFVDLVLMGDKVDGTTVSIVPYAGAVNPGPLLFDTLGGTRDHDNSSCIFLEDADFTHPGMPYQSSSQIPHFHKWSIDWGHMDWGWCPSDFMRIRPLQNDATALKTFIDAMRLHDGTGTMFGMKYGLALLDPNSRDELDVLEAAGEISDLGKDRPLAWDEPSTEKFIVLMTDGKITDQFQPQHIGFRDPDEDDEDNEDGDVDSIDGIDHDKLNAEVETDFQGAIGGHTKVKARSQNLTNFYNVCNEAKSRGVIVFTIAYEAPAGAAEEMRNCATTTTHFYEVSQIDIDAAFSSIARQINKLRLTQ
jgi:Flp pilus assembly protein TadG